MLFSHKKELNLATCGMDLAGTMLSEVKDRYHMTSLLCGIYKPRCREYAGVRRWVE